MVSLLACHIIGADESVLHAAAQNEQSTVLTGTERGRNARPWPPAKVIRLVMVGGAETVE
jgi:hypothetical protein